MSTFHQRRADLLAGVPSKQLKDRIIRETADHLLRVDPRGRDDEEVQLTVMQMIRDEILAGEDSKRGLNGSSQSREPQLKRLVEIGNESGVEFFRSPNGDPFVSFPVNARRETERIRSAAFRGWLATRYRDKWGSTTGATAMRDAVDDFIGRAYGGKVHDTCVRLAHEGAAAVYLDLADEERRVVRVTAEGWSIIDGDPPMRFRRPKGMVRLPEPERGGHLDELLRPFKNLDSAVILLIQAFLLSVFQPQGAFPLLVVHGEQGSAKSSLARLLKWVVDPSSAPLRSLRSEGRDPRDLMVGAANSMVLAFDNLSKIDDWLSDALCRLSSGAGISVRELYSDSEETILEAKRPVILTGITALATRPDLLDRSILVHLKPIPEEQRRSESEMLRDFDLAHPRILGALLDAVSTGIRNLPGVQPGRLSRLADFDLWISACAPALGTTAELWRGIYLDNRKRANEVAIESSPVGAPLRQLLESGPFEGTMSQLLEQLDKLVSLNLAKSKYWPKTAQKLAADLERLKPSLRPEGWEVRKSGDICSDGHPLKRTDAKRPLRIERSKTVPGPVQTSALGEPAMRAPSGEGQPVSPSEQSSEDPRMTSDDLGALPPIGQADGEGGGSDD